MKTFTAEYDADQDGAVMIMPKPGKSIKVISVYISAEGALDIDKKIRIAFEASNNSVCTFFVGVEPSSFGMGRMKVKGSQSEPLKIFSDLGGGQQYFVAIDYREE